MPGPTADSARAEEPAVTGTQSVERGVALLRIIAERNAAGARLTDVVAASGLKKATVHRLLTALVRERLVAQDKATQRYHLGVELFTLGVTAASRYGIRRFAAPSVARLAELSADTVYLSVRSNMDAVCIERVEGSFPIKTLTLAVGDRRPLGVGAGSLAILAALPEWERQQAIAATAPLLSRHSETLTRERLEALVEESRNAGYAFNDGLIIEGMCAVGVPILSSEGDAVGAISIAAIRSRMRPERREELVAALQREAAAIGREIARPERSA
jgi:DNA-binding IclR family transcriptional regulator